MWIALLTLSGSPAWAQGVDDELLIDEIPIEEIDDLPNDAETGSEESAQLRFDLLDEDEEMEDFTVKPPPPPPKIPRTLPLETAGLEPLSGAYEPRLLAVTANSVVVELPVLVARSRAELPTGVQLIASVFLGEERIAEAQQLFGPTSLLESAPTLTWFTFHVPVTEPTGSVKILVRRSDLDDGEPERLFVKAVNYTQ